MGAISTETFDREDNQHDLTHWHDKIEVIRVIDHEMYCAVNGTEHLLQKGTSASSIAVNCIEYTACLMEFVPSRGS